MRVIDWHLSHGIAEDHAALLGEWLLRLASAPGTLSVVSGEIVRRFLEVALKNPLLLRAARSVVLSVHFDTPEDSGTAYRGWQWS